ncbi:MATE family efflux transporter [Desulforhopalus sp. 52FAK]
MSTDLNPVTGKIFPVFLFYAIPSVIGLLAMSCAVVVDGFFLGNYAGIASLASVNLTLPATGLLCGLALMVSVGGAIRCGNFIGAGDIKAANTSFSQSIVFISILSLILTVIGKVFMDQFVFLITTDSSLAPLVAEYLDILLCFTVFQLGSLCLSYYIRVANLPFWASASMIVGCCVNVFLDWIFIAHFQLGHQGAAFATGLSATVTFVLLVAPFCTKRIELKFCWRLKDISEVIKGARAGFPEFVDEFSFGIFVFIFNWIIMRKLGESGVAAFSIINYMVITALVISYGISDSMHPIISQNHGALKHKRIKKFIMISTIAAFALGVGVSCLLVMIPQAVSGLFIPNGERETTLLTHHFISKIWPVFIVNGINIVLAAYLTAMNRCIGSTLIILSRNILLPVLFLIIIHLFVDGGGILIVLPLSELFTFALAIFLFYKNRPDKLMSNGFVPSVAQAGMSCQRSV